MVRIGEGAPDVIAVIRLSTCPDEKQEGPARSLTIEYTGPKATGQGVHYFEGSGKVTPCEQSYFFFYKSPIVRSLPGLP